MLTELRIKNYAVIADLSLSLDQGLAVLTGETGAGKSIIVGALSLLLGERASGDLIRAGEDRAVIEAAFDISDRSELRDRCEAAGIDCDEGWLVLRREVKANGRSRAWINGTPATASLVGEFGQALIELHGQHEHQALLRAGPQREILDSYGDCAALAADVARLWSELGALRRRQREIEDRRARTEERLELLRHQVDEIGAAELDLPDEDLRLASEERKLAHAEELLERAVRLCDTIHSGEGSIHDQLGQVGRELAALAKHDPAAEERFRELFETAYYTLNELGEQLAAYREAIDLDPSKLEQVRARIDLLYRLKAKYGPTLEDVIEAGRRSRKELDELDLAGFELDELWRREAELASQLNELTGQLSRARREAADALAAEVMEWLPGLGMPDGRFDVKLAERSRITATGAEEVEFQVTLNPGFDPLPLSKVASGGELSRIMLALKTILARLDRTPTLIFDEIDVGIGGIVAQKVAEALRSVAKHHQVFVITHLPQIAAVADHHLLVTKGTSRKRTATAVAELKGDERVRDIARMLGGDPQRGASLEHARALLAD